jgi:hypothetical protein
MRLLTATLLFLAGACAAGGAVAQDSVRGEVLDDPGGRMLRCESEDGRTKTCAGDIRGGVRLARQLSETECIEGTNWGYSRAGVWVSQGCRAEFVLGFGFGEGGATGYAGQVFRCESTNGRWRLCEAQTRRGVELVRQLSRGACIRDDTWGWNERGVWVSRGCRGEFRSRGRRRAAGQAVVRLVRCESPSGRTQQCPVDIGRGVRLARQLSRAQCIEGQSWGFDRTGIWVSHGCRAEFELGQERAPAPGLVDDSEDGRTERTVRCESIEGQERRCGDGPLQGVQLTRQLSRSSCVEGTSWGWDRDAVWVSQGCRADFRVW